MLQHFTAESSRELMSSGVPQSLEQYAKTSADVTPPLQIVFSTPFCSFLTFLCFTTLSLLPSSLLINSLSSKDKDFKFLLVSLLREVPLACRSSAIPSPCFKLFCL